MKQWNVQCFTIIFLRKRWLSWQLGEPFPWLGMFHQSLKKQLTFQASPICVKQPYGQPILLALGCLEQCASI